LSVLLELFTSKDLASLQTLLMDGGFSNINEVVEKFSLDYISFLKKSGRNTELQQISDNLEKFRSNDFRNETQEKDFINKKVNKAKETFCKFFGLDKNDSYLKDVEKLIRNFYQFKSIFHIEINKTKLVDLVNKIEEKINEPNVKIEELELTEGSSNQVLNQL
jgi:hypothetical protein